MSEHRTCGYSIVGRGWFLCLQTVFLGFDRYYCLSLACFSSGEGLYHRQCSCVVSNSFARRFECKKQGNKSLSILPAPACSQLAGPACSQISFSFSADHSALDLELTSDLKLFIQNFLVFPLERKSQIFLSCWLM